MDGREGEKEKVEVVAVYRLKFWVRQFLQRLLLHRRKLFLEQIGYTMVQRDCKRVAANEPWQWSAHGKVTVGLPSYTGDASLTPPTGLMGSDRGVTTPPCYSKE